MTFRTAVQDGLIVINTHGRIPDGTEVEVLPVDGNGNRNRPVKAAGRSKAKRGAKSNKAYPLPGFGAWKKRTDITDTPAFARELRRRVSTRSARR